MRDAQGNQLIVLLKMGSKEHLEQFRRGSLYLNTLSYFRDLEADPARADPYEGVDRLFQPSDVRLTIDFPGIGKLEIPPEDLAGPIRIARYETAACNLLCLFSLSEPAKGPLFCSDHEWFGDSVVLIKCWNDFVGRVIASAKKLGFATGWSPITYYDERTFTGKLGRFSKQSRYAYQQEYRIAVLTTGVEPLRLEVGDLSDITTEVIPIEVADKFLKFTESDALDAGWTW